MGTNSTQTRAPSRGSRAARSGRRGVRCGAHRWPARQCTCRARPSGRPRGPCDPAGPGRHSRPGG
eukprot:15476780-Alexandrium_andersonii.AAC.2